LINDHHAGQKISVLLSMRCRPEIQFLQLVSTFLVTTKIVDLIKTSTSIGNCAIFIDA